MPSYSVVWQVKPFYSAVWQAKPFYSAVWQVKLLESEIWQMKPFYSAVDRWSFWYLIGEPFYSVVNRWSFWCLIDEPFYSVVNRWSFWCLIDEPFYSVVNRWSPFESVTLLANWLELKPLFCRLRNWSWVWRGTSWLPKCYHNTLQKIHHAKTRENPEFWLKRCPDGEFRYLPRFWLFCIRK